MSPGRLVYFIVHRPREWVDRSLQFRGPINQFRNYRGRKSMERAARELRPRQYGGKPLKPYFLTGHRFWYQTVWCAYSLAESSRLDVHPVVFDDGTLSPAQCAAINEVFPGAEVHSFGEARERLLSNFSTDTFPNLIDRWHHYPNIRKLIDPHLLDDHHDYKMVLDSDMLFFSRPAALLEAWNTGLRVAATDVMESYGYQRLFMESLTGQALPKKVNVGIAGMYSSDLNWREIEEWIERLHNAEGTSYFLEQALIAMLFSRRDSLLLDGIDYRVMPPRSDWETPSAVMHHYVAESKEGYFRHTWRYLRERTQRQGE